MLRDTADTIYCYSQEPATALLRDNAAALAEFVLSEHYS